MREIPAREATDAGTAKLICQVPGAAPVRLGGSGMAG